MTERPPFDTPRRLSRRRRYALAVLPLLMAQPGLAQDSKPGDGPPAEAPITRGLRQEAPSPDQPTGIQTPPAEAAPVAPVMPMQPVQTAPDPMPQQVQPTLPMQPTQAAPPAAQGPQQPGDPQQLSEQDPPPRVGRVARMAGQVSYRAPGQQEWTPARVNFSVSSGTAIFTQPNSRAAIEVNASRFAFDPNSDFQIQQLTEQGLVATLPQGAAYFRMSGMLPNETAAIVTPRGTFTIQADGRYLVEAGSDQLPTRLTVLEGTAQAQGEGYQTPIPAGQTLVLVGDGAPNGSWTPARPTALVAWAATMEGKGPMPASVRQMTGAEVLTQYGRWDRSSQYGDIWYPRVEQGWAPYRNGQWVWRDPWGWTWVDDAPWGYAPSHYGRWVQEGGRWGWLPQVVTSYDPGYVAPPRPFWAPALVSFLPGVEIVGLAAPVSWVPLAPYEPFLPWWRASPYYVNYVNLGYVRNITVINNYWVTNVWRGPAFGPGVVRPLLPGMGPFAHLRHAVVVPGSVLTGGLRVAPVARPLPPGLIARPGGFTPAFGGPIVRPIAQTPGLTPIGASRLGLPAVAPINRMPGPPLATHSNLIGRPGIGPVVPGGAMVPRPGQGIGLGPAGAPGRQNIPPPPGLVPPGGRVNPAFPGGVQPGPGGRMPTPPGIGNQMPGVGGPNLVPPGGRIGVPPPPSIGTGPGGRPGGGIMPGPGVGRGGQNDDGIRPINPGGRFPGVQQPPGSFQPPPGGRQPGFNPPGGGFQPPLGGRQPGFTPPAGGFQPPPGGRQPGFAPPGGGFQPPPGGRQPGFAPPSGGFQPPPGGGARSLPPAGGGGGQRFSPPPQQFQAPPRPVMQAPPPRPVMQAPPPRPVMQAPPPQIRQAPPPPQQQRRPGQR